MRKRGIVHITFLASLALVVAGAFAPILARQRIVTSADIQRLQDDVFYLSSDIGRVSATSAESARLTAELNDLREEAIYLKVKLRKTGSVTEAEFDSVQTRLNDLRARISPGAGSAATGVDRSPDRSTGTSGNVPGSRPTTGESGPNTVPVNTELDVRLQTQLSSATAQVEDRFEATTVVDLYRGDRLLVPAGSVLRGVVTSV
ncbi:MAG: hypothetical protein HYX76_15720, partial [Acidobacteria bacterium]|nr:hypothetical protein [Acidobacteriota bacterium]